MSAYIWPLELPQVPQRGFSESIGLNILRTPMDAGVSKQRVRSNRPSTMALSFVMSSRQVDILDSFVRNTIKGVRRFDFPHPRKKEPQLLAYGVHDISQYSLTSFSRTTTATYLDASGILQTAEVDVPRYENGALLLEPASTNKMPYSDGAQYIAAGGTTPPTVNTNVTWGPVVCSSAVFPTGAATGYGGSRAQASSPAVVTLVAGKQAVGSSWISFSRALTGSESIGYYWFGCSITLIGAAESTAYVNKWGRISAFDTETASGSNNPIIYVAGTLTAPLTVYWGRHQWEEDRIERTSYIPTTTTAVTRAADFAYSEVNSTTPKYSEVRIVPTQDGEIYKLTYLAPEYWTVTLNLEILP